MYRFVLQSRGYGKTMYRSKVYAYLFTHYNLDTIKYSIVNLCEGAYIRKYLFENFIVR